MALKARNPDIQIGLADPDGAALYNYYTHGELKSEGNSITEGIGQGRITANLEGLEVDHAYRIPDAEALPYLFDLLEHEGLCLGGSSGDQHRRRGAHGARPRAGQDHRHRALRLRQPLPEQALQPGVPASPRACRSRIGLRRRSTVDWRSVVEPDPA